jgi:hypothetical protein
MQLPMYANVGFRAFMSLRSLLLLLPYSACRVSYEKEQECMGSCSWFLSV